MSEIKFSSRILRRFAETIALELGADQFNAMLSLANLPAEWKTPDVFLKLNPYDSAHVYAALQTAMRTYFGRGARGVLLRVGQRLWHNLLDDAALGIKAQAAVVPSEHPSDGEVAAKHRARPGRKTPGGIEVGARAHAEAGRDFEAPNREAPAERADER